MTTVAGLLLAAGAGRRMGRPKALVRGVDGVLWVVARTQALLEAGCAPVVVVVGAAAGEVSALLPSQVRVVLADRWSEGMGASLRAGLGALQDLDPVPQAAAVVLVDTPGLTADAVRRVAARAGPEAAGVLVQATYAGLPGHPVLLGREHWAGICAAAVGDRGARDYLREAMSAGAVLRVECADLADGRDVDQLTDSVPERPDDRPGAP